MGINIQYNQAKQSCKYTKGVFPFALCIAVFDFLAHFFLTTKVISMFSPAIICLKEKMRMYICHMHSEIMKPLQRLRDANRAVDATVVK